MKPFSLVRAALAATSISLVSVFSHFSAAAALPTPPPTPTPSPTPIARLLDTLVVTAQRHETRIGATSREVYVMDAGDLRRTGANTVAEGLRFVPGVTVQEYGTSADLQTVALRGAAAEQTLVLLNGRPVNEPDTGLTDFSSLPLDAVDRVEIVEGGASALYGSAAVGGVINVITKPWDRYGSVAYAQAGYRGAFSYGVGTSDGDERGVAARLDLRTTHADNAFDFPAFAHQPAGTRANNDAKTADVTLTLSRLVGQTHVELHLNNDASTIGAPGPTLSAACCASSSARQQRVFQRGDVSLTAPFGRGTLWLQFYADDRRLHFYDPAPPNCQTPCPYDTLTHATTHGYGIRTAQPLGRSQTITAGIDSRGNKASFDASFYVAPTFAADAAAAWYINDEIHAANSPLSVSLGLRAEHPQGLRRTAAPSFGILDRIGRTSTLKVNYARAFRVPNLDERFFPDFGNAALEPEYAATFDLGIVRELGRGTAGITYFGADTNNLIIAVCDQNFNCSPQNVKRARVRGVTLEGRGMVGHSWQATLAYTDFLRARDLGPGLTSGNRLLYRPTAAGGLTVWRNAGSDQLGIDLRFEGKRYADEANTLQLPAYASLGAHVIRNLGHGRWLSLRADNLTRERVEEVFGYPVLGPTLTMRLSVTR